jgi:preprotein translocase subunit YajC
MTSHLFALLAATSTTTKSSSSSGSSYLPLLILLLLFAALYVLVLRPRQRRMRQQQSAAREISVGSEVMSVGGIMGTVVGMTDSTFDVEVGNGVVLTFIRRAVNPRPPGTGGSEGLQDSTPDPWDAPPEEELGLDEEEGGGPEGPDRGAG